MNFSGDFTHEDEGIQIDLTSFIDVLFVLLLFFMVATTFVNVQGVSLDLPQASKKSTEAIQKQLVITIHSDGTTFFSRENEEPTAISKDQLSAKLSQIASASPETSILIHADKKAEHGSVVAILDIAKSLWIKKIAIATRSIEPR